MNLLTEGINLAFGTEIKTEQSDLLTEYNLVDRKRGPTNLNAILSKNPLNGHSKIPVCFISMARSGTNFLIAYLSYGLSQSKKWCGSFIGPPVALEGARIDLPLLEALVKNRRISWSHADGGSENIAILKRVNLPLLLQMRDPRQAFLSWIYHELSYRKNLRGYSFDQVVSLYLKRDFPKYISWVAGWLHVVETDRELRIFLSFYEEMIKDLKQSIQKLLHFLNFPEDEFDWPSEKVISDWKINSSNQIHYRKGALDEWRTLFSEKQIDEMNRQMPDSFFINTPWRRYP